VRLLAKQSESWSETPLEHEVTTGCSKPVIASSHWRVGYYTIDLVWRPAGAAWRSSATATSGGAGQLRETWPAGDLERLGELRAGARASSSQSDKAMKPVFQRWAS